MVKREFWLQQIEQAWRRRSVVWLHGVRRAGKTVLCKDLADAEYFDCDLPSVRERLRDPEMFWRNASGPRVVLDEIHQLPDPSLVLKIAADHFPERPVIATGSSALSATAKFSDALTGRKAEIWLTPMISDDLVSFGGTLERRLWHGGLPPLFLADAESLPTDYAEWLSSYWSRDIQLLFRVQQRSAFLRFVELVLARSGGMFEATAFAEACEVSRPTILNYLNVLEVTGVATVVRPFSSRRTTEIVAMPKVYGFDTGFVRYSAGWQIPRQEDLGLLWEHYVLNEILARVTGVDIRYWRAKKGPEVDFVLLRRGVAPVAVECKWSSTNAGDLAGLRAFRRSYTEGVDFVVCADIEKAHTRRVAERDVQFVGIEGLVHALA